MSMLTLFELSVSSEGGRHTSS